MTKRRKPRPSAGTPRQESPPPSVSQKQKRSVPRADRYVDVRRGQRIRRLRRWALIGGVTVAVVGGLLWVSGALLPQLGESAPYEGGVGVHVADGTPLSERNRPPSSGPHYPGRSAYGVSNTPIEPGSWLHALEHGGIAILFKCSGSTCADTAAQLEQQVYASARPGRFGDVKLVITPYQEMQSPIAAVAWGRVLPLETLDAAALLAFYDRYLDRGPEDAR